ncbi:MAG: ferritin [Herpetosiphonaceae bacterium]|nr:ferritin [Herpetosiphonaceae bacterium]
MINHTIQDALNEQIKHELESAYLYLSMAAYFESVNLQGFAHWMRLQHQEETAHGMKLFNYLQDRGGRVRLQAIEQPKTDFSSSLEVFEQALKHEQKVTALINGLYDLAIRENDHATQIHLQWFITEQVEEEKNAQDVVDKLKMAADHPGALFLLDQQLASRMGEAE